MQLRQHLIALACVAASALATHAQAEVKTLTDVTGNQVKLNLPAQRVALGFHSEDYMAVAGEKGWARVVGISKDIWKVWRPESWKLYVRHMPALEQLPDLGNVDAMTFSVEKLLALKPDVLVLAEIQLKGLGSDVDRIRKAGVPIVVVDYNAQTLERHMASTALLGEIAGQPGRAAAMNQEYKAAVDDIKARLAKAKLPQPKVYAEFGNKGPAEYSFTYGKNMWGAMIEQAGGINIAKPFVQNWGPINPEQVLAAKPDVVLISGTEITSNPAVMRMGQGVPRKEAAERLAAFGRRAGWDTLPAVQHRRLHGVYHGVTRSPFDYTMLQYMAKAFYPTVFADLQPEQNYIAFYKKYLPVVPQGTFAVSLDAQ